MIEKLAGGEPGYLERAPFGAPKGAQTGRPAARYGHGSAPVSQAAPDLLSDSGDAMHSVVKELYPICRSITGDGVRATLACLSQYFPLEID